MKTVAQVAQAFEIELLCMTYEIFLENLQHAIDTKQSKYFKKSREALIVLINNLNMSEPLAHELFDLYIYVQKLLLTKKDLDVAFNMMSSIKDAYQTLMEQGIGMNSKVLANTQNIYSGMTYGKNNLDEFMITDNNRGFMA